MIMRPGQPHSVPIRRTPADRERRSTLAQAASGHLGYSGPITASANDTALLLLFSDRCHVCGTREQPLYPAGMISVPDGEDIVRDYDIAVCTEHLGAAQ
jgi:hypothetical protein